MALTLFSRSRQILEEIESIEWPLKKINKALETTRTLFEANDPALKRPPHLLSDGQNRKILKALTEIIDSVLPPLEGAWDVLDIALAGESAAIPKEGLVDEVMALKENIGTAVQALHRALDMDWENSSETVGLHPSGSGGRDRGIPIPRALARARRHLQTLELPSTGTRGRRKTSGETERVARTLEQVAFQTNLLTLNAAVEASRAEGASSGGRTGGRSPAAVSRRKKGANTLEVGKGVKKRKRAGLDALRGEGMEEGI